MKNKPGNPLWFSADVSKLGKTSLHCVKPKAKDNEA